MTTRAFPPFLSGKELFRLVASRPEVHRLPPAVVGFFREHMRSEKAVAFRDTHVINSHFPPVPSAAWERFVKRLERPENDATRLHSVTWGVTNRCGFRCWHCYNAGRNESDVPLEVIVGVAERVQDLGAVMIHLTGGEPLLRDDLESIARLFGPDVCLSVGTTGQGLSAERARSLAEAGVFAVGISLDSEDEAEHDAKRGVPGAFRIALDGLAATANAGMYPYVVAVASHELLGPERFPHFLRFVRDTGALEVHLLEPCPVGNLASREDATLSADDRRRILEWQKVVAKDRALPILSSFAHLESPESFGCGAGSTHLYIDGSGEVCPCQLVPLSFGNIQREPLTAIIDRMAEHFTEPRPGCVGFALRRHIPDDAHLPTEAEISERIVTEHLPAEHKLPAFFRICRESPPAEVGMAELRAVYDDVHGDYDEHWLSEAAGPVRDLVERIPWPPRARVFEAGCGTGFCTALVAERVGSEGVIQAADISEGMLSVARRRIDERGFPNVKFAHTDALEALARSGPFDVIISSWVLGYIPLDPFFAAVARALAPGGRLGFVVHRENSPREALEIFQMLAAEEPDTIERVVDFDFPRGSDDVAKRLSTADLNPESTWEGAITFRCASPEAALQHLLRSGAGTAYLEAVHLDHRDALTRRFVEELATRHPEGAVDVVHDFVGCVAVKSPTT